MTARALPRSVPGAQGVDAAGIAAFLDAVAAAGLDLHSLMVLRHGQVVAEGWWEPYRPDRVHLLYSLSKSFTSTAIGIAMGEGRLSLDDPVVSFFPDRVPATASERVRAMRVRHLLAMASGHATDTWATLSKTEGDLVAGFLALPPDAEPGTLFCYNQGCTYTLSAIITELTGQRLLDYLGPRLFEPLGIDEARWLQTNGIDQGFSGLHVVTESVAKLGQLHLQGGRWDGRQLVPEAFLALAHSKQVDNSGHGSNPDWQQGYGFQFWMCRHGAYRGDGAFGQFCVIVPDADAVIVCTAQVADMQGELDLIWEHLLPAVSGQTQAGSQVEADLAARLAHLSTPLPGAGGAATGRPVTFARAGEAAPFTERLGALRVEPDGRGSRLVLLVDGTEHAFSVQPGSWTEAELPDLRSPGSARVAVTGGWNGPERFEADVVYVHSPHRLQLRAATTGAPTVEISWYQPPL